VFLPKSVQRIEGAGDISILELKRVCNLLKIKERVSAAGRKSEEMWIWCDEALTGKVRGRGEAGRLGAGVDSAGDMVEDSRAVLACQ
jgi:hypothetical protein